MKIISIVAARPNFMKIAPFIEAINHHNEKKGNEKIKHILVHTGQHYDDTMSARFFQELNIPSADINLGVGSGTHAEQVGYTMIALEKVFKKHKPDWVVVIGDVNAILAGSVTAKKEWIKCCHIEAGLRSGDLKMPEEINRLVADKLSDLLLTPDLMSSGNLKNEGVLAEKIVFVGNIMIDTLEKNREKAKQLSIDDVVKRNLLKDNVLSENIDMQNKDFAVVTLHRPSNVDDKNVISPILDFLIDVVASQQIVLCPCTQEQKNN